MQFAISRGEAAKYTTALLLLLFFAVAALGAAPVQAQEDGRNTYLIQFQPGVTEAERSEWLAAAGAHLIAWLPQINVAQVEFAAERADIAAAALAMTPVVYAEADALVTGVHTISDPAYADPDKSYAQHLLRLAQAWDVTEGDEVIIAIVDSGINLQHPEFSDRLVPGYDFVNKDDDPSDDLGHGTHVAGIAGAGLNGIGTVGVCPQCKLMPVKVLNANNSGNWGNVAAGILYAVDHGAQVINLSLGATISSMTLVEAVGYAQDHNVVVVAAAGNRAQEEPFYPAALPTVIAVGGTDKSDGHWQTSSYGDFVDVCAPAVSIYSTYYSLQDTSGYAYMSGTSMASPFVSGLAGLLLSRRPDLTVAELTDLLTSTAVDLGDPGKDKLFGYGRVDAYAALLAANDGVTPEPADPPTDAPTNPPSGGATKGSDLYLPVIVGGS